MPMSVCLSVCQSACLSICLSTSHPLPPSLPVQEHKCVLDSCRYVENEGFEVTYLPVQGNGLIKLTVS